MFFTLEKLQKRAQELGARRYRELRCIAPFTSMPGGEQGPDVVYRSIPDKIQGGTTRIGDLFEGRDQYLWIEQTVELPPAVPGCEPVGLFDFGGGGCNDGFESLLYVDGQPYQGVDANHGEVVFTGLAGKTVRLTFMLWSGMGGGAHQNLHHRIGRADVGLLDRAADELYHLCSAISGSLALMDADEPCYAGLLASLNESINRLDWDEDRLLESVPAALAALKAALAKNPKNSPVTVHVVGHTHIDVAWLWRYKHTREKAMRSFASVLHLMDAYPDYIFLQSQPQLYRYIQQDSPELYAKIRERVREGRWEADGGMWVEADCNLTSGESLVRQFLHGITFLREEFGTECRCLWLPDVFGYSWALPQILKQCGLDTFATTKISWNQYNSMPNDLFLWRGIDGTEMMTYFIDVPGERESFTGRGSTYNGMITPHSVIGSWKRFKNKELAQDVLLAYGYGDGGGGVNREMLELRRALDQVPGVPQVKQGRVHDFFGKMHENLDNATGYVPVWDGELYLEYHRGTYTSQARNKKLNRKLEYALTTTEWLSSLNLLAGGEYDAKAIHDGWETLLLNQFHDVIPGSSIHEVYEDSARMYGEIGDSLRAVQEKAFARLCAPEQDTYTVLHTGSFAQEQPVLLPEARAGRFTGADGRELAAQRTQDGTLVLAPAAALSLQTIRFTPGDAGKAASPFTADAAARTLETPFYSVQFDAHGAITRLYDKQNAREVFAGRGNVLEIYEDKPMNYDAWDVDLYHMEKREEIALSGFEVAECGPVRVALRFKGTWRRSSFAQDVVFYAHSRRIDFETSADWHEDHRLLKTAFEVAVRSTKATYDIQYGHVERPTHWNTSWDYARFEVCGHKWADLSETGYGVSLLSDCKYGYAVHDGVMRLSLLKSAKHPDFAADMGEHAFTYALVPHAGTVADGGTIEEGEALNLPPVAVAGAAGLAGKRLAYAGGTGAHIDAIKKAEKGSGIVVRLHECRGGTQRMSLGSDFAIKSWEACNLLEEGTGESGVGEPSFTLHPFEIRTFILEF